MTDHPEVAPGPSERAAAAKLPRWRSHKQVWADRIVESRIHTHGGLDRIDIWTLEGGGTVQVFGSLRSRVPTDRSPVGGYYVLYDDGYESWSPASAFEDGYRRVEPDAARPG